MGAMHDVSAALRTLLEEKVPQSASIELHAITGMPLIRQGDSVATAIIEGLGSRGLDLRTGDIVVIAQKIISKAEGALLNLADVVPTEEGLKLAQQTNLDARYCQAVINESVEILYVVEEAIICRHRLGFVCMDAAIDRANAGPTGGEVVVLLPRDPDASARSIREQLAENTGADVAIVINDSFNRKDRFGSVGTAIGASGIRCLESRHGQDLFGFARSSHMAVVDELAAAASILMGQTKDTGVPAVIARGMQFTRDDIACARDLARPS